MFNFKKKRIGYSESGYRMIRMERYELFVDMGNIGPDYIPGHAHADTFNFLLNIDNKPVIVDTGISTYEKNEKRQLERSTESHNTVAINDENQSRVWGGFRVAERAKVFNLNEGRDFIEASHDGFKKSLNAIHSRKYEYYEKEMKIIDNIKSKKKLSCSAYIHFHPNININLKNNKLSGSNFIILVDNAQTIDLKEYQYCLGYNKLTTAQRLCIRFLKNLLVSINVN